MRTDHVAALTLALSLLACRALSPKPGALEVCEKLENAGVAANCAETDERGGLVGAAKERANFDIPGEDFGGQVLTFDSANDYDATVRAFDAAAALAGRHRYGNPGARVFVQMNSNTSAEDGEAAERVVAGL